MDDFKSFFAKYGGGIIGLIVAILLLVFELDRLIIGTVIIIICVFLGNYVQKNKEHVKEKLKAFIDRM